MRKKRKKKKTLGWINSWQERNINEEKRAVFSVHYETQVWICEKAGSCAISGNTRHEDLSARITCIATSCVKAIQLGIVWTEISRDIREETTRGGESRFYKSARESTCKHPMTALLDIFEILFFLTTPSRDRFQFPTKVRLIDFILFFFLL